MSVHHPGQVPASGRAGCSSLTPFVCGGVGVAGCGHGTVDDSSGDGVAGVVVCAGGGDDDAEDVTVAVDKGAAGVAAADDAANDDGILLVATFAPDVGSLPSVDVADAGAVETALAWKHALESKNAPSCLILSRQNLPPMQRTLEQTVNALAVTSEKRDPFTAGHQERVSRLAERW